MTNLHSLSFRQRQFTDLLINLFEIFKSFLYPRINFIMILCFIFVILHTISSIKVIENKLFTISNRMVTRATL